MRFVVFYVLNSCTLVIQADKSTSGSLEKCAFGVLAEDLFEGSAKVFVEDGVDDWVKAAVAVADPKEELKDGLWEGAGFWAHSLKAVGEEEGKPADDEDANHDR